MLITQMKNHLNWKKSPVKKLYLQLHNPKFVLMASHRPYKGLFINDVTLKGCNKSIM